MPALRFNPKSPNIIVHAKIKSRYSATTTLVLDTGASLVVLPWKLVTMIGIKIDPTKTVRTTTATTVETVPEVIIPKMDVLGKTVKSVKALIKDLPPESPADGLLGLSFLKNFKLTLDFKNGVMTLE